MKMYAEYVKERENKYTVFNKSGFAVYAYVNEACYITDIFIKPSARKKGQAAQLADQVKELAIQNGSKKLMGSVDIRANGSADSMKVLLAYGMSPLATEGNLIYFVKDI